MWNQDLKDTDVYYSEVTSTAILVQFRAKYIGLLKVDTIIIQGEMMDYFLQV